MLILLITVVVGTVLAVFATYNIAHVILNFPIYGFISLPIYIAVILPLIIGLVIAYGVHIMRSLAYKMQIGKLKGQVKDLQKELNEVNKDAHKFEVENSRLKGESGEAKDDNSI